MDPILSDLSITRGVSAFTDLGTDLLSEACFRKVVVAGDDPGNARSLEAALTSAGYEVSVAAGGKEALDLVQTEHPHFLITDWQMPVMDGIELCRKIRKETLPHYVYVVFLTFRSELKDMVQAISAGADTFLVKPVIIGEVLARLQAGMRVLELEQRLIQLACCDCLTELLNRRVFFRLFEQEWVRSARNNRPIASAMIDVDFFKRVNDQHGHRAGDTVLRTVAQRLNECCRKSDQACRYGGEEFAVLLPETDIDGALRWAERARNEIGGHPITTDGTAVNLTVSIGVAHRHTRTETPEQLLDQADQALLNAKRKGRNRVEAIRLECTPCPQ